MATALVTPMGEDEWPLAIAVERNAALACLGRLNKAGMMGIRGGVHVRAFHRSEQSHLCLSDLMELAAQQSLQVQPAQLDWQQLQAAVTAQAVLLILTNAN